MIKVTNNPGYTFKFVLHSGDDEETRCQLIIAFYKWLWIINLPALVKPDVHPIRGQYNYDLHVPRAYGMYLYDNHFNILYGRGDANIHRKEFGEEQRWSCFLPWNEWRFVRHSIYGMYGEHVRTLGPKESTYDISDEIPTITVRFKDYDGEDLRATLFIEEREWYRGVGNFSWLSRLVKPRVSRSLNITFNGETGKRKGTWKGGVMGTSIEMMDAKELHISAFRRYCKNNRMSIIC